MYDPEQKQFILKNSLGVSYHVYHENGRGLCVRMLGDRKIWSRGYILSDQAVNDFFATLDNDDIFHFIFQSMDGRIMYGHGRHGQIETHPILSSRDPTPWPKHVNLIICGNIILFFYTVRYQNRYLLSMQTLREGALSKPAAIDYVDGTGTGYIPVADSSGKCHLIYTNRENSESRVLHRVIKDDFSIFNVPRKIYATDRDITNLSAISPDGGHIHLLFQVSDEGSYEVLYKNLSSDKAPEILYSGKTPPGYTGLVYSSGVFNFFRITGEGIHGRISRDGGKSWSDEAAYPFGNIPSLTCFIYHTNIKKEKLEFCSWELPGTFSQGYQLAFFNNPVLPEKNNFYPDSRNSRDTSRLAGIVAPEPKASPSPENEKKTAAESLQLKDIQKKVLLLQNLTENMQRELTKLWLMQKEYDKKLDNLSRLYAQLRDNVQLIPEYDDKNNIPETASGESPVRNDRAAVEDIFEEAVSDTVSEASDETAEYISCLGED